MIKKIVITVDVERDVSKYLHESYIGIEEGLPPFLKILRDMNIKADFFISSDICIKYPEIVEEIIKNKHNIGSHGNGHGNEYEYYCTKNFYSQYKNLLESVRTMEKIGLSPVMFRAPNFSVNVNTIKALESLNFQIDSSVLPGRIKKKYRLITIYDFRSAPRTIYKPSYENINKIGNASITEVPLTENPFVKGAPISLGYLNTYGIDAIKKVIETSEMTYITFLIHPWEMIDLSEYYPNLRGWFKDGCMSNLELLEHTLKFFKEEYVLTTIEKMANLGIEKI